VVIMSIPLNQWACRILLSKDPYGPAVVGIGSTAERAEREAERLLKGRKAFKRSTVQCSGSKAGAL
jgi:hypothetical protein